MASKLGYDLGVKRGTVAGFAFLVLVLALAVVAQAQIPAGVPASVTSVGPGGQPRGVPASVTSIKPAPGTNPSYPVCCGLLGYSPQKPTKPGQQHHHNHGYYGGTYLAPYGVPVPGDQYDESADGQDPENGGPTIFDRRGPGTPLPSDTAGGPRLAVQQAADPAPNADDAVDNQSPTVLVFKDGHEVEVANYAIVGSTLYDLTDGHRRKIGLAELDLSATSKENDSRGVDFQVPNTPAGTVNN
jgi:hypothetical protein